MFEDECNLFKDLNYTEAKIDSKNAIQMCDLINKRLEFTVSYSNWLSIVYHFLITSGI